MRPPPGDLVVTGRLTTDLCASPTHDRHGPIEFCDGGEPTIVYGAAFAVDASGAREPITTAYDGQRISLRLPAAWLATARFPVTIDPLTSATKLVNNSFAQAVSLDIARDNGPSCQRAIYWRCSRASSRLTTPTATE